MELEWPRVFDCGFFLVLGGIVLALCIAPFSACCDPRDVALICRVLAPLHINVIPARRVNTTRRIVPNRDHRDCDVEEEEVTETITMEITERLARYEGVLELGSCAPAKHYHGPALAGQYLSLVLFSYVGNETLAQQQVVLHAADWPVESPQWVWWNNPRSWRVPAAFTLQPSPMSEYRANWWMVWIIGQTIFLCIGLFVSLTFEQPLSSRLCRPSPLQMKQKDVWA